MSNDELSAYIEAWSHSADQVIDLGRGLTAADFLGGTDLPDWSVHDIYAHLAALEAGLAGAPDDTAALAMMKSAVITPSFTEIGVDARRGVPPDAVLDELATHVEARRRSLDADLPTDPDGPASGLPAGLQWDWRTLLRNRAIDMWVHEQDIRRAVDRPGNVGGPGAQVTVTTFARSLPYIIGKRVGAPAGTIVAWNVAGAAGFATTVRVRDDGRARIVDEPSSSPDVAIAMDAETFAILGAGRRDPRDADVTISGDTVIGTKILASMVLTP